VNAYITLHQKDAAVLPYCVQGLRARPEISNITVIAGPGLAALCRRLDVLFLDEDDVVPGVKHDTLGNPRWGWYFQQILKLGIAWLEQDEYYLVVDADTVFLHQVRFLSASGLPLYTPASEYHLPYFTSFERLLGFKPQREASFIAHHMVFQCDLVKEMCSAFGPNPLWWRNIVDCMEPKPPDFSDSRFSEYETYGHYVQKEHPGLLTLRSLRWRNVAEMPSKRRLRRLARDYDFVSFQEYLRTERRLSRPWRVFLSNVKKRVLSDCS
jgi:hypothetical protein